MTAPAVTALPVNVGMTPGAPVSYPIEPEPTVPPPGAPGSVVPDSAQAQVSERSADQEPDPGHSPDPGTRTPSPGPGPGLDVGTRTLDPRIVLVWRLGLVPSLVLPLTVLGGLVARLLPVPGWSIAVPLAVLLGLAMGPLQTLRWRRWTWRLTPSAVELRFGVLTRRHVVVPHFRVQQIDVFEGPLERLLGLATLTVTTASAAGSASLPGLPATVAPDVRSELLELAARANLELGRSGRDAV